MLPSNTGILQNNVDEHPAATGHSMDGFDKGNVEHKTAHTAWFYVYKVKTKKKNSKTDLCPYKSEYRLP